MNNEIVGLLGILAMIGGGAYIFITNRSKNQKANTVRAVQQEVSYPLRLQAYERMILFLERIKPQSLLTRISPSDITSMELQGVILKEIRSEFDHNAAQQLYIKKETWEKISNAATTTSASLVHAINQSPDGLDTKGIVVWLLQNDDVVSSSLIANAIQAIKDEAQENF